MTTNTNASGPTAIAMHKRAGDWLQQLREEVGKTQVDMAEALGHRYSTMVSQIERGRGRVPPEDWVTWAELLRQQREVFCRTLLYWYDPHVHHAIFGGTHPQDEQGLPREASNSLRNQRRPKAGASLPS